MEAFIDVRNVSAGYRTSPSQDVLHTISCVINHGDHVVVFGAPASGKSSFLKMLCGDLDIHMGSVVVNGKQPAEDPAIRSGYVCLDHEELRSNHSVYDALIAFGDMYDIPHLPAKIGGLIELLEMKHLASKNISALSTAEKIVYSLARATLSDSPVLLLDDVLDVLGVDEARRFLDIACKGKTVVLTTRVPAYAEQMNMPMVLLHHGTLAHAGMREDIAVASGVPRIIDAWVEALRYDMLKKLRSHSGVLEVRILPTDRFEGNLVRVVIRNSRFMPSLYDLMSQSKLVHVEEVPPTLTDILRTI